jgi:peroxiredoxin
MKTFFRGRLFASLLIVLFVLPLLSGCSDSSDTAPVKTSSARTAAEFSLKDIDGNDTTLSQLEGKVVLIDFWATWCPPCRDSIPHLSDAYERYKDRGFEVVGVSLDTNMKDLADFIKKKKLKYKVVVGNQSTKVAYGVSSIPRMFIVDRKGIIQGDFLGFSKSIGDEMDAKIEKLLAEQ